MHSGLGFRRAFRRILSLVRFVAGNKTNKLMQKRGRIPIAEVSTG